MNHQNGVMDKQCEWTKNETKERVRARVIFVGGFNIKMEKFVMSELIYTYQRKNGNQHAKNALIIIPSVRAAFFSRRIFVIAHGSTWCILCRCTAIPLICKCFSSSNAATFDLKCRQLFHHYYHVNYSTVYINTTTPPKSTTHTQQQSNKKDHRQRYQRKKTQRDNKKLA